MKKIAILTLVVATLQSFALSFTWTQYTTMSFGATQLKNNADVTGYLVYLGKNATLAESYTYEDVVDMVGDAVSTARGTAKGGKTTSTKFSFDYGYYTNGDVFAMIVTYDVDGDCYYNIASGLYTLSGIVDETTALDSAAFTGVATTIVGESDTFKPGTGWTKVPEPATGALALAGLALLFKRRRA